MHLLILDWGAYTQTDIYDALSRYFVTYKSIYYCFGDKNKDDFFYNRFCRYLTAEVYDAVFTVNYFPLIAEACYQHSIKYISWSYDNPLNVVAIEATLGYETNYVFLFDRIQVEGFHKKGFLQVYHLPLGIPVQRLNQMTITNSDIRKFTSDISFVGKLYPSLYPDLIAPLSEYTQGYLNALIEAQLQIYGYYMLDELLTHDLLADINRQYREKSVSAISLNQQQLSYAMATFITRKERLLLLTLLSKRHHFNLFSREKPSLLSSCHHMGSVTYLRDMPKVFKLSKINLNITLKILQSGIPLRALDILGSGGLLFSNYQPELAEYLIPDYDYVQYGSMAEAVEKADYYLRHETLRAETAQRGHKKAAQLFDYNKQLTALFQTVHLE